MRRYLIGFVLLGLLALFIWVGYFLYQKNQEDPVVYQTAQPFIADIIKKTVATGAVNPRNEIFIKPQISGIIDELYVEPGDYIKKGTVVARIKVIPDDLNLNSAEMAFERAKIALEESTIELKRREELYKAKAISEIEYNQFLFINKQRKQDVEEAENSLQLIRDGVSKKQKETTTIVKSTVNGMVLDVPVKEGAQVIESNNFNDGTTIAAVANMSDLVFEGNIDESEVGKIKVGMELLITVGAIENKNYAAELEYISPKGVNDQGTIQFKIRAAMDSGDSSLSVIRAGYSANADIILDERKQVLAIMERDLMVEEDKSFVEVEVAPQKFEKREVKTGLSDGINIEILSGITASEKIKAFIETPDVTVKPPR